MKKTGKKLYGLFLLASMMLLLSFPVKAEAVFGTVNFRSNLVVGYREGYSSAYVVNMYEKIGSKKILSVKSDNEAVIRPMVNEQNVACFIVYASKKGTANLRVKVQKSKNKTVYRADAVRKISSDMEITPSEASKAIRLLCNRDVIRESKNDAGRIILRKARKRTEKQA